MSQKIDIVKMWIWVVLGIIAIVLAYGLVYAVTRMVDNAAPTTGTSNVANTTKESGVEASQPTGGGNTSPTATSVPTPTPTAINNMMVGGTMINPCTANPDLQIEPLRENGQVVPNAFMGLDLNRTEVDAGLRYVLDIPSGTYAQYFEAWTGTTWEAVGPTTVVATAWTSWCNNAGWISQQGFPTGQHRIIDAKNLPTPLDQWITRN